MLLGERGRFGGTVDVTGGEKKPPSVYVCLCTLACLCVFMFVCTVYAMLRKRGRQRWGKPFVLFLWLCVGCIFVFCTCVHVFVYVTFVCVKCRFC